MNKTLSERTVGEYYIVHFCLQDKRGLSVVWELQVQNCCKGQKLTLEKQWKIHQETSI